MSGMRKGGIAIYSWLERRLGLGQPARAAAVHEVPSSTSSWWYVFGSAATVILGLQVVTGILLAIVYTPSASHAWSSLQFLDHNIQLGWFLRALHGWGSDFMIAIVLIHMAQVFLFGAYKFPRELTWIVGVFLLLLTLGMAFTGQVLRFDQDAYWGLGIGASILSRVPIIGGSLIDLMLGGPIIAGPTLTRFFALHVFIIPGILLVLVGLHLWMVLRLGINEWPMPGRIVSRATYTQEYSTLTKETGIPFVLTQLGRMPSSLRQSCSPSLPVPSSSAPSDPLASLIQLLSRPYLNPTSPSSGSLLSSRTFRRILKPQLYS